MIKCFKCSMKAGKFVLANIIYQYSNNLGELEKRKIEISYTHNKYKVLKTPWVKIKTSHDTGFFCSKCNSLLQIDGQEEKDFIKEKNLIDIRRKYIKNEDFNSGKIAKEILENYTEEEYKEYDEPAVEGKFVDIPQNLNPFIPKILNSNFNISKLYKHQADTIKEVLAGNNVVLETSTASGKTLAYNIPIINHLLSNPESRFLYISPTKALSIDQMRTMTKFGINQRGKKVSDAIREFILDDEQFVIDEQIADKKITLVKFDRDIKKEDRNKAIEKGQIFYSTPDKIHSTILQFYDHPYKQNGKQITWKNFFENLKFIVIDEIHTYKGVFGANVAYVLRRLQRLCEMYGNDSLQFISCSATIKNPKELADTVTGKNNILINNDTSPKKKRKYILLKPVSEEDNESISPVTSTADIVTDFLSKEKSIRSITFGRTMQTVRKTQRIIEDRLKEQFPKENINEIIKFFQGNLKDTLRQKLINNFNSKEYHALISTIALELGMDLDDVHSVLMIGYSGTTSSYRQQAGRAGRKGEGLIITSLFPNPLENYFFNNPEYFFNKPPEKVIVPINNISILEKHLLFAELEGGINENDYKYFKKENVDKFINNNTTEKEIIKKLYLKSIRTAISKSMEVYYHDDCIADSIDINTAKRDIFKGAIFQQPDNDYKIVEVDWKSSVAKVEKINGRAKYETQSFSSKSVETIDIFETNQFALFSIFYEKVKFINKRLYYYKISKSGDRDQFQFDDFAPPIQFETNAVRININSTIIQNLKNYSFEELTEGAVGIENALLSMFIEIVECDIHDVGSATIPHETDNKIDIYLYDNFPGGLDFTEQSFHAFNEHLKLVYNLIVGCNCKKDEGCPSCVQIYKPFQSPNPSRKIAIEILKLMKTW